MKLCTYCNKFDARADGFCSDEHRAFQAEFDKGMKQYVTAARNALHTLTPEQLAELLAEFSFYHRDAELSAARAEYLKALEGCENASETNSKSRLQALRWARKRLDQAEGRR